MSYHVHYVVLAVGIDPIRGRGVKALYLQHTCGQYEGGVEVIKKKTEGEKVEREEHMEVNPLGLCLRPPLPNCCIAGGQQQTIQWFEECGGRGPGTTDDDLRNGKGGGHGRARWPKRLGKISMGQLVARMKWE